MRFSSKLCVLPAFLMMTVCAQAEVMMQWFETEWTEMYRRMPEVASIGYDYI